MSEHTKEPPPVVPALRTLANHMRRVAVELRVSGTPAAGTRGAELAGAALLAEAWADEIEADNAALCGPRAGDNKIGR